MRHNQNRRSRGRSGRKGPNPLTRSYESNGPDVKVRGTPAHIAEKYMALARDAMSSGDTVAAENYLQHAEHYNRIIAAAQAQAQQGQPDFRPRDGDDEGYDGDRQMNGRGVDFARDERDERDERGVRDGDGEEAPAPQPQAAEPERPRRRRRPRGEEEAGSPAPRQRGGERSAASPNGAGEGEEDTTHDGQAALAAFPD